MKQRLKRVVSCMALCALLAGCLTVPAAAAGFTDVPSSHWAASSIQRCVELGLFQGETASRFGVGHRMTRGAFAVVLCRFFGWETTVLAESTFPDVPADAWYAGAVEAACDHGAITRQSENFRPGEAITREELAVMLVRALGYGTIAGLAQELPMPFRDVDTNAGYIAVAYRLGLVSGTSDTTFSPERTATREQAAVMLMRLHDRLHGTAQEKIGIVSDPEGLTDLTDYEAVAVAAGRLVYTGSKAQMSSAMSQENVTAVRTAAEEAGVKQLLHVSSSANPLKASASETAAALADAVAEGGWDGLFLDAAKLKEYRQEQQLTALVTALRTALGDKLLYVAAEAPVWNGTEYKGYDYAALGRAADKLVLRMAPYSEVVNNFPAAPQDPLEEIYYALCQMQGTVDAEKLSLMLTTTGSAWKGASRAGSVTAEEIVALLEKTGTEDYYSSRYACAYLRSGSQQNGTVVWYLDGQAVKERTSLAGFFGVEQVCLSDLGSVSGDVNAALQ